MEYKTLMFVVTILKIMEDLQRVVFVMILHIKETSHCVPILTKYMFSLRICVYLHARW